MNSSIRMSDRSSSARRLGVIAYIPRLVLFDEPWGVDDDKLVCDVCPTDHDLRVWLWILEQDARRVFGHGPFLEAFGAARDRIEQRA